ncbi:MAG: ATPase, T2SS/T4P/T4SS family [Alcanivoracaceae bacterium]|nr:ATPase, T2SS/T4P/T4SS family [Alcanivoracaceae bacterium]
MTDIPNASLSAVIDGVPRGAFIASPDLEGMLSGHSIPSRKAVRSLLALMPPLHRQERVLLVGAGSGYLAAILSRQLDHLDVLERDPDIAGIARSNLASLDIRTVDIHVGEGEAGYPPGAPYDRVLAVCLLERLETLLEQLGNDGELFCLDDAQGQLNALIACRFGDKGEIDRHWLGLVDFSIDASAMLIDMGLIDEQALASAREEARKLNKPVLSVIQRHLGPDNKAVYRALAKRTGVPFMDAEQLFELQDRNLFRHFSRTFLDHYRLLPVYVKDGRLQVVTDDADAQTDSLSALYESKGVDKILVTPTDYRRLWSAINILDKGDRNRGRLVVPVAQREKDTFSNDLDNEVSPYLVAIYESILLDAVSEGASDIHFERYPDRVRIRLRVDGELYDLKHLKLTPAELIGVINVIKTRAELDISEHRLPQGGRSRMKVGQTTYDLRVQTQPSLHGEHAVIRLLPQSGRAMGIDELGLSPRLRARYRRLLDNPAGLVLIVGPTGSGKSTTLSAGLQELADDGARKVITVEDPVEYAIDNIQQTRVRNRIGFGFADAMRSFVRQDPDVILVGEIRDAETALEAARASQTGHLVLSTLHCNDAVDAIQRLYDLGLHPNSIASELRAVMAQRLARRICPECRQRSRPPAAILKELFPEEVPSGFVCYEGAGCNECNGRGTHGRIAVTEYLQVNDDYRDVISARPHLGELRWRALDAGMVTMRDSALELVLAGIIPMSELPRILPQERLAPERRGGERGFR